MHSLVSTTTPEPQVTLQVPMTHGPYEGQTLPSQGTSLTSNASSQSPSKHSLVSNCTPGPYSALHVPMIQGPYTGSMGAHGGHGSMTQETVLDSGAHMPLMHVLVSVLIPVPQVTLQDPMTQSAQMGPQSPMEQDELLSRGSVHAACEHSAVPADLP